MMLRAFIALTIPAEIQEKIARQTADLRRELPKPIVRWVATQNIHLTLKFLGDVSPSNLELLAQSIRTEVAHQPAFPISVGGIGIYPNARRPRVVWIGIEAPPCLISLHRDIEAVAARLGYPPEDRMFQPHLTIGRISHHAMTTEIHRIRDLLTQTVIGTLGTTTIDEVHIFRSDLKPTGAIYTNLYAVPLAKTQEE